MTRARKCRYCDATENLRPYGPGGADVCYPCAMATPGRTAEAERQLFKLLDVAGPGPLILTGRGPRKLPGAGSA